MSGFSSKWLSLREPLDVAARNRAVEQSFLEQLPVSSPKILDLASGAGSTVAALKDRLPANTRWLLTDHDKGLIDVASKRWKNRLKGDLSFRQVDLAGALEDLPFGEVDAVSTSAFLDLVSESFLTRLVDCIVSAGKPFLASLTYDGQADFAPPATLDRAMRDALNTDQLLDKGFGPALGPGAAPCAVELFKARGYNVLQGQSDWRVDASEKDFLEEFLNGWAGLGLRKGLDRNVLEDWRRLRSDQTASGEIRVRIGHIDFAAFPRVNC